MNGIFFTDCTCSYKNLFIAAIVAINKSNSGFDTLRIKGDIFPTEIMSIDKGDITIIGDVNTNGTPKYTLDFSLGGRKVSCYNPRNYVTIENIRVTGTSQR